MSKLKDENCSKKPRRETLAGVMLAFTFWVLVFGAGGKFLSSRKGAMAFDNADGVIDVLPEDLSYQYNHSAREISRNYTVTGLSQAWQNGNPGNPGAPPELNIIIPAVWNDGINGEYRVTGIGENAFRCGTDVMIVPAVDYILDYSIVSADFSRAVNLASIYEHAFRETDVAEIDLGNTVVDWIDKNAFRGCESLRKINAGVHLEYMCDFSFAGCTALEVIDLRIDVLISVGNYAFYGCGKLKTIYLGCEEVYIAGFIPTGKQLPVFDIDPFGNGGMENIVFYDKSCMEEALAAAGNLSQYATYFTYEQEVVFAPNGGDGGEITELKLFNRPLDYVKEESGAWKRNEGYALPSPGVNPGYVYRWAARENPAQALRTGSDITIENRYTAVWTYALTARIDLPQGYVLYTDKKPADIAQFVTAEFASDGYTAVGITDFTVSHGDGETAFREGENTVVVSYGGCAVRLAVIAELPPPPGKLPAWAWWLIGAGIFSALCAAAAIVYGIKKKGIFVRETTVVKTETVTERVEVVHNVPVTEGQPVPMGMFTASEKRVAELLLLGKSRREIADILGIAENTARNHTANILSKAEVNSQKAFIAKYIYDKNFFEEI